MVRSSFRAVTSAADQDNSPTGRLADRRCTVDLIEGNWQAIAGAPMAPGRGRLTWENGSD